MWRRTSRVSADSWASASLGSSTAAAEATLAATGQGQAALTLRPGKGRGGKSKDKGKGGKGQPAGKPQATESWVGPPRAEELPMAPAAQKPLLPKALSDGNAIESPDAKLLEALISHARGSSALPPNLQQMLDLHVQSDAKQQSKRLHQLVTQQQDARKQLLRVRSERLQFEQQWGAYVTALLQTWEQQTQDREQALKSFLEAEIAWSQQLNSATTALSRQVKDEDPISENMDLTGTEDDATLQDQEARRNMDSAVQYKQITAMLREAQDKAQAATFQLQKDRDASRSPRRKRELPADDQNSAAHDKAASGEGHAATNTGVQLKAPPQLAHGLGRGGSMGEKPVCREDTG